MNKLPKRLLIYRGQLFRVSCPVWRPDLTCFPQDGVSESEFKTIINEELRLIRGVSIPCVSRCVCVPNDLPNTYLLTIANKPTEACDELNFSPTITLIVVGKDHKVVFFPVSNADGDKNNNCVPGTVIDSDVVSPVEFDYYLYGHAGLLGTSKPAHFNVLHDENDFTCVVSLVSDSIGLVLMIRCVMALYRADGIQALSFALCHVYARCTRSVSIPAPVYCKFSFPALKLLPY